MRFENIRLTDDKSFLKGKITPSIKHPTSKLPNGRNVLGLGDAIILNDPIAGQGANVACKTADLYFKKIIEHDDLPFDENWMIKTSDLAWENFGKWSTRWSNLLLAPPKPHVVEILKRAAHSSSLANKLANGFDEPGSLFPLLEDTTISMESIS